MKFNDGKTFSAYVRSKLHSGYITLQILAKFSSLDSKCVVKVFCLTLVLLCFLGMAIKSANFTFLATSFSVNNHTF